MSFGEERSAAEHACRCSHDGKPRSAAQKFPVLATCFCVERIVKQPGSPSSTEWPSQRSQGVRKEWTFCDWQTRGGKAGFLSRIGPVYLLQDSSRPVAHRVRSRNSKSRNRKEPNHRRFVLCPFCRNLAFWPCSSSQLYFNPPSARA